MSLVAREERSVRRCRDHERSAAASAHDPPGARIHYNDRTGSLAPVDCVIEGVGKVDAGRQIVLDEMGNNLAVDVGEEHVTRGQQRVLQVFPVFDNPVVHDIHGPRAIGVRMRVALRDTSVRRPAGVADPNARKVARGNVCHALDQLCDTMGAAHLQRTTANLLNRDADGIVASVFECLECLTEVFGSGTRGATCNDAAHQDTESNDTRAGRA
jgi:hypothetical protein